MVTEDWMVRQVEALARSIAMLVFHKEETEYVPSGVARWDGLHRTLMDCLAAGDACGGEDLLFEAAEAGELECLEAGVDFYARLNRWSDPRLEEACFEREEIQEGLRDLSGRFGISL